MNRRNALKRLCTGAGALACAPHFLHAKELYSEQEKKQAREALDALRNEPAAIAQVRMRNGGARLLLNGKEVYPLLGLSRQLLNTVSNYSRAGIRLIMPFLGTRSGWLGDDRYDWSIIETFLGQLLRRDPGLYFLPRLHLNTPEWWLAKHPDELIEYALPIPQERYDVDNLRRTKGGHSFDLNKELREASFASIPWRRDTAKMLQHFIRYMDNSPLKSRILGYHFTTGRTAEWNSFGERYMPDISKPMRQACGTIPDLERRLNTTFGLLRDPQKEQKVIDYIRTYHQSIADTILYLAKEIRRQTQGRILSGVYYAYIAEQVHIQEGGYLAPLAILKSPDIDYLAAPYTYQNNNFEGDEDTPAGMVDDAGNWFGRARGVGGDGGYRIPVESVKRHGKMFINEIDPSTYISKRYRRIGGPGSTTVEGTRKIFRRDLGQMFATGDGGWLYDFGPMNKSPQGWYSGDVVIGEMKRFATLGEKRPRLDLSSCSDILVVSDSESFCASEHWLAGKPWEHYGIGHCDFFNHWFLNTQARSLHRIGAPFDTLFPFDLTAEDFRKYKLVFMSNLFYLRREQVDTLLSMLKGSGVTVVWFYAPGFISKEKLDLKQMQRLSGFSFDMLTTPGPLRVRTHIEQEGQRFKNDYGLDRHVYPRFVVTDEDAEKWGWWTDNGRAACASRQVDGWRSVYAGAAPLPAEVLRILARQAGVPLWIDRPDIVRAVRDAAMVVATSAGKRRLELPQPLAPMEGGGAQKQYSLDMDFGDVKLFVKPV
jgi:hypothetical protein